MNASKKLLTLVIPSLTLLIPLSSPVLRADGAAEARQTQGSKGKKMPQPRRGAGKASPNSTKAGTEWEHGDAVALPEQSSPYQALCAEWKARALDEALSETYQCEGCDEEAPAIIQRVLSDCALPLSLKATGELPVELVDRSRQLMIDHAATPELRSRIAAALSVRPLAVVYALLKIGAPKTAEATSAFQLLARSLALSARKRMEAPYWVDFSLLPAVTALTERRAAYLSAIPAQDVDARNRVQEGMSDLVMFASFLKTDARVVRGPRPSQPDAVDRLVQPSLEAARQSKMIEELKVKASQVRALAATRADERARLVDLLEGFEKAASGAPGLQLEVRVTLEAAREIERTADELRPVLAYLNGMVAAFSAQDQSSSMRSTLAILAQRQSELLWQLDAKPAIAVMRSFMDEAEAAMINDPTGGADRAWKDRRQSLESVLATMQADPGRATPLMQEALHAFSSLFSS